MTYKHVTLMAELSHAVERRSLMAVSGVEQDVACQAPAAAAHYEAVAALVRWGGGYSCATACLPVCLPAARMRQALLAGAAHLAKLFFPTLQPSPTLHPHPRWATWR